MLVKTLLHSDRRRKRQRLDTGTENGHGESEMDFHDALDAVVTF